MGSEMCIRDRYRKANRKWGSTSRTSGSPPYFHFWFDRWRPPDARFRRISARAARAWLRVARRSVRVVEVVRRKLLPVRIFVSGLAPVAPDRLPDFAAHRISARRSYAARRCARRPPESSVRRVRSRQVWRTLLNESVFFFSHTLHPYGKNFGSIFYMFLNIDFRENRNERSPALEEPTCTELGKSDEGVPS